MGLGSLAFREAWRGGAPTTGGDKNMVRENRYFADICMCIIKKRHLTDIILIKLGRQGRQLVLTIVKLWSSCLGVEGLMAICSHATG